MDSVGHGVINCLSSRVLLSVLYRRYCTQYYGPLADVVAAGAHFVPRDDQQEVRLPTLLFTTSIASLVTCLLTYHLTHLDHLHLLDCQPPRLTWLIPRFSLLGRSGQALSKRVLLLLHLRPQASRRPEVLLTGTALITHFLRRAQYNTTAPRKVLGRQKSVWTICWPRKRASTDLKENLQPIESRRWKGRLQSTW